MTLSCSRNLLFRMFHRGFSLGVCFCVNDLGSICRSGLDSCSMVTVAVVGWVTLLHVIIRFTSFDLGRFWSEICCGLLARNGWVDSLPCWRLSSFVVLKIWNCCCKFRVSGYGFSLSGFVAAILDFFRCCVDWFWWVIRIIRYLPFFGGGCGTVVGL